VTVRCARGELPLPDPSLHNVGNDETGGTRGRDQLRLLEHYGLTPSSDLLEIGCGLGRLAYECASYLDDDATYTGFDIAPVAIEWLEANYAPRLPGFRFDLLDVYNERYRPNLSTGPEQVRFPYDDASFDVVCAFEVFMHVALDGVRNYLQELTRVLRPGGTAVVSFMAIYPEEEEPRYGGRPFVRVAEGVYTRFPNRRSTSMGFDVDLIRRVIAETGLEEVDALKGRWHTPFIEVVPISHGCDLFALRRPA